MNKLQTPSIEKKLAYFVSAYPAISHTFILREILSLRRKGHQIITASINKPDRPLSKMDAVESKEASNTYCLKSAGILGALNGLLYWLLHNPLGLTACFRDSFRYSRNWITGIAYGVEAAMVGRWLRLNDCTHLHVHFGNVGATVGMLVKVLTGCHLSYTIHGPDEFDDIQGQQLARKMAVADHVICISQFAIGQLMRISDPIDWDKLELCRLGVNLNEFNFDLRGDKTLEITSGPVKLLSVGRLTPAKCQTILIQACAILRDSGILFHLTIVGAGPDLDRVKAAILKYKLADQITLTGALTQEGVRNELAKADIFVLPSLAEGIPVVLMESMASGVPCVSTPVNGIPELIEDGVTGLLALPGDPISVASKLKRLINDPHMRDDLAIAAQKKLQKDFDLDSNVTHLSKIFKTFPG